MSVRVRLNNKVIKGIIMNITKEWRWYHNSTMVHLWVNLLISAREEDGWYGMIEVKKGQVITSLSKLSAETGISIRKIRTCLSNLVKSGEIKEMTNNHYRIITIIDYDMYQKADVVYNKGSHTETKENDKQNDNITTCISEDNKNICDKLTNNCQTNDKQLSNQEITTDKQVSNVMDSISATYDCYNLKADRPVTNSVKVGEKETKEKKENSPHTPYKEKKEKKEKDPTVMRTKKAGGKTEEEMVQEIKNDQQWLEAISQYHNLTADRVYQMINKYCIHRICAMSSSDSIRDIKRHFDNWLRIQLTQERRDNERNRVYQKRTGLSANVCKAANYRSSF
jgi:phage protein